MARRRDTDDEEMSCTAPCPFNEAERETLRSLINAKNKTIKALLTLAAAVALWALNDIYHLFTNWLRHLRGG